MDFRLSEEQELIKETARQFALNTLLPFAARWDEEKIFPTDALRQAAELGFAAIYIDEAHGGVGLGRVEAASSSSSSHMAVPQRRLISRSIIWPTG